MILLDYNGMCVGSVFSQDRPEEINEPLIRHMILNGLRYYNQKFRHAYGHMVVACDSESWRRECFPEYKAARDKKKDDSPLDWSEFFRLIGNIREEVAENLPYSVIMVDGAEADDIIGYFARTTDAPTLIVSADKDFLQLQRNAKVKQYSPMKQGCITPDSDDIDFHLFEHICRGDSGDGIPSVLSDDRVFVDGVRQKPLRKTKIDEWYLGRDDLERVMGETIYKNYCRNQMLIDLRNTPKSLCESIGARYESQRNKKTGKVMDYLVEKRCGLLIDCAADFLPC